MKRWILIATLLYSSLSFAQKAQTEWATLLSNDQVEFQTRDVNCTDAGTNSDTQSRLIKVRNKTNSPVSVTWLNEIYYGDRCITCNNAAEYSPKIILKPGETVSGDCSNTRSDLKIFLKDNKGVIKQQCADFKVSNVSVTSLAKE